MSYVPGLIVETNTTIRKVREIPLAGEVRVKPGERVKDDTIVLTAEILGEILVIRIAEKLGCEPGRVKELLLVKEGMTIEKGTCIAELKYLFGILSEKVLSPCAGKVEYFIESTAHLGIREPPRRVEVNAYISGTVTSVEAGKRVYIETRGALIQGIFGIGGERRGEISLLAREGVISALPEEPLEGRILVGGATFSEGAIRQARDRGVVGIVTGSITSAVLTSILKRPLGVSVTGDEELPFSLIVTEGFGELPISDRTFGILSSLNGKRASMNGATQVRAGAMRPEIIVSEPMATDSVERDLALVPGTRVRCIRAPYFGALGEITDLPGEPREVESGAIVRVAKVKLQSGNVVTVPRANLELLSG